MFDADEEAGSSTSSASDPHATVDRTQGDSGVQREAKESESAAETANVSGSGDFLAGAHALGLEPDLPVTVKDLADLKNAGLL